MAQQDRKCPFCEEVVLGDATVCHFCGREIHSSHGGEVSGARGAWRTARTFLIVVVGALVLLGLVFAIRGWLAGPMPPPVGAVTGSLLAAS